MKKIFLTLFAAALICISVAFSASAQTYFELNPEQITSVTPGGEVSVDVTLDNITAPEGLVSVDFELTYSSNLTFSSATATLPENWDFWTPVSNTTTRTVKISAVDEGDADTPVKEDGEVVFTLNFTVASDFASGDVITLSFTRVGATGVSDDYAIVYGAGNNLTYEYIVKPTELIITKEPYKDTYTAGQKFYSNGLNVAVLYSDGTQEAVTDFTITAPDMTLFGEQDVIVSWNGLYTSFKIVVNAPTLNSISVTPPTKTTYIVGETLNTAGMVVTANYANSITKDVTTAATVDTTALNTKGTVTVTVTYEGLTATFTVTVNEESVGGEDIASGAIEGTDITWAIDADGVLTVSGTGTMPNYANTNSNRAPWYADRAKVTSIVVAEGMTSIGNFAFHNCSKATKITLPESLTTLTGASMIRGTAITEVDLSNVVVMTKDIFASATSVERVIFSESFKDARGNIFGGNTLNITVVAPEDSYAYKYVEFFATKYAGKANLTAEANGVAECPIHVMGSIGESAIYAFYKMGETSKGVDINWMVISGEGAVRSYWYISEARKVMDAEQGGNNFAPTYYMYEDTAFGRPILRNTKKLQVLEGITSIGNYSFYRCLKAQELEILGPVDRIGNAAFQACEAFRKIIVPDTVKAIGKNAFNGCKYLKTMTIPDSVTSIGETIFKNTGIEAGETRPSESATLTITTTNQLFIDYINTYYPLDTCKVVLK